MISILVSFLPFPLIAYYLLTNKKYKPSDKLIGFNCYLCDKLIVEDLEERLKKLFKSHPNICTCCKREHKLNYILNKKKYLKTEINNIIIKEKTTKYLLFFIVIFLIVDILLFSWPNILSSLFNCIFWYKIIVRRKLLYDNI